MAIIYIFVVFIFKNTINKGKIETKKRRHCCLRQNKTKKPYFIVVLFVPPASFASPFGSRTLLSGLIRSKAATQ